MTQLQKRLAAQVFGCSARRVRLNSDRLAEIKESITKDDIRRLINKRIITRIPVAGISRVRAVKQQAQKRKGRRRGKGSRKGKAGARLDSKLVWMNAVRLQREALKTMRKRGDINANTYRSLYKKIHGNFFRSIRHLRTYVKGLQ